MSQLGQRSELLERTPEGTAVRRAVASGGLRVITEQVPGMRSAAVGVWIGVGSRDERSPEAGAAHYLEHLLFKGTARRSAAGIAEEVDAVGGELNAFTAKEHTCYYAHVLDADLRLAIDVLGDVVTSAVLADPDVELERQVVLEEIAMRDDDPEDLLHEDFCTAMFGDHPLALPVLGSPESVRGMSRDQLLGFHREHYTHQNIVVAVAGNLGHLGHDGVVAELAEAFAPAANGDAEPVPPRGGDAVGGGTAAGNGAAAGSAPVTLRGDDTEQAHLMLGGPGYSRHDERRYPLAVLNAALGGGMSSRLFQQVREQRGLAYSVYSSLGSYADTGTFSVYAGCAPERLGTTAEVIAQVLREVAANGLSAEEVRRAQGQLRGAMVLGLEDAPSRMTRIGKSELNFPDYRGVGQVLAEIDAVSQQRVRKVAAELLNHPFRAAVVGPFSGTDELPGELTGLLG